MLLNKETITNTCFQDIKNQWICASDSFPTFLTHISTETKLQNEAYIKNASAELQKMIQNYPLHSIGRKKWKKNILQLFDNLIATETIIRVHDYMSADNLTSFMNEIKNFLRHVRTFSPELDLDGIGQAIRNYIVYAMFNEMNGITPRFSPAAFGYSMLYPFTDNYIDNASISAKEKADYNRLIRDKIEGKTVFPKNTYHIKTCKLLEAIETEYPRDTLSPVYSLLIMMLDAQEDSMCQHNSSRILSEEERLCISVYKGGVSVLIDRFFVHKDLTEADLIFYLGFGFFLQLADDLQDIQEDSMNCSNQTLFSTNTDSHRKEQLVNKMLNFVYGISENYMPDNALFKNFVLSNCYQLVFSSVVGSKEFFSQEYVCLFEQYLLVASNSFEDMKRTMPQGNDLQSKEKYMKILDELLI